MSRATQRKILHKRAVKAGQRDKGLTVCSSCGMGIRVRKAVVDGKPVVFEDGHRYGFCGIVPGAVNTKSGRTPNNQAPATWAHNERTVLPRKIT